MKAALSDSVKKYVSNGKSITAIRLGLKKDVKVKLIKIKYE